MSCTANWEYWQLGRHQGTLGARLGLVACTEQRNLQPFQELPPNFCGFQGSQLVQGEDTSDGRMCVLNNFFCTSEWIFTKLLTHVVHRSAVEHYKEIFGYWPQNIWDPKTTGTYFWQLHKSVATLRANISGEEHDIDIRKWHWKLQMVLYIIL